MSSGADASSYQWNDTHDFPRDLVGYGEEGFDCKWPNNARLALSFVINYEEGAERTVMNGDGQSEVITSPIPEPASSE